MNSWWPSSSDFVRWPCAETEDQVADLAADLVERGRAFEDAAGVDVHVVGHAPVGLGIGADLDDRRDGRADHRAAPGDEQDGMAAAGDQLGDLGVVVDVGEAEADLAVGHDVEQIEAAARRDVAGLDQAGDRRGAGLGVGAHRLLLDGGEAALGVAGGERAIAERRVVARRLGDAGLELGAELRRDGAVGHDVLAADQLAGLLEDAGGALLDQQVEGAAGGGIAGDAGGPVRAAADGADDEFARRHRDRRHASRRARCSATKARPSAMDLRVPPVAWMTMVCAGRPLSRTACASLFLLKLSQPSETSSTAPTFGWVQSRSIIVSA